MIEGIGLRLRIVVIHSGSASTRAGKHIARGRNVRSRTHVVLAVFSTTHARHPRAPLAALAIAAFTLGTLPLASPAAPGAPPRSPARSAAAKAVVKKPLSAKAALAAKKTAARSKPAAYRPHNGLAPADEYFGRLQMSVLGVRNKVKDLGLDVDIHPEHDKAVLGNALWVEDAMRDWARKYPFDRWLPRYAYALEQMYERIPGGDAHKRAVKQVAYLTAYFPQTVYGRVGRAKLAQGVPVPDPSETPAVETELERLALLDGKVIPTLPPAPAPTAAAATASPAPTPSATPAATPTPVTTPAAASTAKP
jgi:hypothetical protein